MTATPVLLQTPKVTPQSFIQGTDAAGTLKDLFAGGTNGSKVTGVIAATDDGTSAHVFTLYMLRSSNTYRLGAVNIPVNSGSDGIVRSVDLLSLIDGLPVDNDGQRYLFLESGDKLQGTFATALTASKRIDVTAIGAHF